MTRAAPAEQWKHPGIRVLLREDGTTDNPIQAIRRKATQLIDHAVSLGWEGPPFDMELLASLNDLRIDLVDTLGDGREASCITGVILLVRNSPPKRKRYSIAHEIIHQFVPDDDGGGQHLGSLAPDVQNTARDEMELLCQIGAAELLMPAASFRREMGSAAPTFSVVQTLSSRFDVSLEAAARRTVDLSGHRLAILMARPSDDFQQTVRVRAKAPSTIRGEIKPDDLVVRTWIAQPRFCTIRVAIGEPIPRRSHIRRAWGWGCHKPRDRRIYRHVETWPVYPELGSLQVEAIPLPLGKRPIEVLALMLRE